MLEDEVRMMAYTERGSGDEVPLLLLHAFPLNGEMWEPQLEAFSRRVVAPDYPGFGRSAHAPAQPDIRYYAGEVGQLMDGLRLERVVLGGASMGGYVAFECLRLFPERVAGLILADTRAEEDSGEARKGRDEAIRRVAEEGVEALIDLQLERLLSEETLKNKPETVERVKAMIRQSSPDGVVAALSALRDRPDSTPLLPEISVPTLVIGGEEDAISSPEVMANMAGAIPDSHHVVIPKAGHLPNMESPGEFNEAVERLLGEIT